MDWPISYRQPVTEEFKFPFDGLDQVNILVRREYQNHPAVSGNKWWKLKYNLLHVIEGNFEGVITFGGAYSNHIYATAAACYELNLKCVGIIRGEAVSNPILEFARARGMQLHFISREHYRNKSSDEFQESLLDQFKNHFTIPEGGTNKLAVKGCEELGTETLKTNFDYLILPVGTGGTMAGLINAFGGKRKVIGIPVLKGAEFLKREIESFLAGAFPNWQLLPDYHHGGYAKTNDDLDNFIQAIEKVGMPLEFVYSGKMFWAAADLIRKQIIEKGSTVLLLHTGGLGPN